MGVFVNAGRELDSLVAEKVMGWQQPNHLGHADICASWGPSKMCTCDGELRWPPYSTSIAAAWQVVEKLESIGFDFMCGISKRGRPFQNSASFRLGDKEEPSYKNVEVWETMPLAICLAALKAVGYEVPLV